MTDQATITAGLFSTQAAAEIQTIGGNRQAQKEPDQQPSEWNSAHWGRASTTAVGFLAGCCEDVPRSA